MLPPAYQALVSPHMTDTASLTVLLFQHDAKSVVLSSTVEKALTGLGESEEKVMAVAGNFTLEAAKLLRARGVEIVSLKDFAWTDESYEAIKVFVRAKVKRPKLM